MENEYLAKSDVKKTIKEHTDDVLKQYEILHTLYPMILEEQEWELLKYTIQYHDLGKMNTKFQNKLYKKLGYQETLEDDNKEEEEIPHNFLSPLFMDEEYFKEKYGIENAKIVMSAVYFHHAREEKEYDYEKAIEDLKKQVVLFDDFYGLPYDHIEKYSERYIIRPNRLENRKLLTSKKYILIKGLLNKLDYVASLDKQGVNVEEKIEDHGKTVGDKILDITKEKYHNQLREVQEYMKENKENNLVVISPTGSGKTEAALLWAGHQKLFYTLPLKVAINAMYERIKNEIKYEKALLLHSDAGTFYLQEEKNEDFVLYERARRLSAPLLVTTVDQLFKIVFRYVGYEEILATLSYSKLIIDEIQMYSPEMIAYILVGLKMITDMGGKFAIVTATFPPMLYDFMDQLGIPYKKPEKAFPSHLKNRHKIQIQKGDIDTELVKQQAEKKKVLVLVNTVRKAQALQKQLIEEGAINVHVLHANYCKKHRDQLEKQILQFSDRKKNQEPGIWISTQIVEASLDIDFDVLFTEMCTIDSLFQRMGRVYRKREYEGIEPNVYIYDNRNGLPYVMDSEVYDFTVNEVVHKNEQNLSEEEKQKMIENIFDLKKNKKLEESDYYKKIKKTIQLFKDVIPNDVSKEEISKQFRNIETISLLPDDIYNELYEIGKIEEWETKLNSKLDKVQKIKIKQEIEQYTINVTWRYYLEYDKEELFYPHSHIYRTSYHYEFDEKKSTGRGLIVEKSDKKGYFDE